MIHLNAAGAAPRVPLFNAAFMRRECLLKIVLAACISLLALTASCATNPLLDAPVLNIRELVDAGGAYDGKYVGVYGYVSYGFEGCTIVPENPELVASSDWKYEVWYWNEGCMTRVRNFKYGYATLYGVYDVEDKGHLWSYDSSLIVDRIEWRE